MVKLTCKETTQHLLLNFKNHGLAQDKSAEGCTQEAVNRSREVMAVEGVETKVFLMLMASFPHFWMFNDLKFNSVLQRHSQAAVLHQSEIHTKRKINQDLIYYD